MKQKMITFFSVLLLFIPMMVSADTDGSPLCSAKDVQHNIDLLRASVDEMQATHDAQRGMKMLHEHMAMIIDNQEIILALLDKPGAKSVECPKKLGAHHKLKR